MRWFLLKIACIAAGYLVGAWVCHDPIGGVLIAPFGWIVGKAVELHAAAKKMGITGYRTAVAEGSEEWGESNRIGRVTGWIIYSARDMNSNPFHPFFDD